MKNKLYLTLVLGVFTCLAGWTAHAQLQNNAPQKQAWEYMEVELDPTLQTTPKLNEHARKVGNWSESLQSVPALLTQLYRADPSLT